MGKKKKKLCYSVVGAGVLGVFLLALLHGPSA
jgi:hypothetical protein